MKRSPLTTSMAAILGCLAAMPVAAQPAGYDGVYAGSMTLQANGWESKNGGGGRIPDCVTSRPVNMTIKGGIVTIWYSNWTGDTIHYHGKVEPTGEVNAWHTNGDGSRSEMFFGRIGQNGFIGEIRRGDSSQMCDYKMAMRTGSVAAR